ncbi:unnamed protein product [Caretta caretta]
MTERAPRTPCLWPLIVLPWDTENATVGVNTWGLRLPPPKAADCLFRNAVKTRDNLKGDERHTFESRASQAHHQSHRKEALIMDCRIWSCEWFSTQQSKHSMTHFETPSLLFNIVTWSFPRPKLRTGALHAMFASISYKYRQPALLLVHFQRNKGLKV